MEKIFNEKLSCEQLPSQQPLFGQVIDRLGYLTSGYTDLTNYAYRMTSRIADIDRLCDEKDKEKEQEYKTDGSIISNLMVTMDKLEDNMNRLKLVVKDLEKSIIQ